MIGGQKETLHLQALCTLGDCVRRTPRMQSAAQMMPMAQTICNTMRWQTGTLSHHTYSHIRCLESWCFRPSTVQSLGIFWQLANMLCDSTKKTGGTLWNQFNRTSVRMKDIVRPHGRSFAFSWLHETIFGHLQHWAHDQENVCCIHELRGICRHEEWHQQTKHLAKLS